MKLKTIALALALGSASAVGLAQPALAGVPGIAVANPEAIVAASNAFKVAQQQRPVTYKAQIDQATARRDAIQAQLKPLYEKLDADSKKPGADRNALQQQALQIRQIEQSGQAEINQILAPLQLSQQYVLEQIGDKLDQATQQAMDKQKVTLVLDSGSVVKADQSYNLNQAILTELNVLIPSAQLVPPAGWMPRAQREQQAQEQAAQAAQQPAQGNPQAPSGR
ncbi:MAG: OmpH family outer membrane protein [Sphingomonadales bacterium]|nr:OmpH family outer membrane protein [Sphingomonadales bacterium]MDE2569324.1 OmpH family outer membrane protein [Sphingomonadales bacterium]